MKKLIKILGVFLIASLVLTSCSDNDVSEKSINTEKLSACDCAKIMKNENPLSQPENEGRDALELQEEWLSIWSPCTDRDSGFMQEVLKCLNTL